MRPPPTYARPAWYDHDSCHDVTNEYDVIRPRAANDPDAYRNLQRHQRDTMDWYRHEQVDGDPRLQNGHQGTIPSDINENMSRLKLRSESAFANFRRMMGGTRPEWISRSVSGDSPRIGTSNANGALVNDNNGSAVSSSHASLSSSTAPPIGGRFNLPESHAYRKRDQTGLVSAWWSHENPESPTRAFVRVNTQDGYHNAVRSRNVSENWFVYEPHRNPPKEPNQPRLLSATALALRQRGFGQLHKVLSQEPPDENEMNPDAKNLPRVRSEGLANQMLHSRGNIHLLFNHASPEPQEPAKRNSKSQAWQTSQKGGIADIFTGYPDPPIKRNGRRVMSEGRNNERERHKDTVREVLNFDGSTDSTVQAMCITGKVLRPHPPGVSSSSAGQQVAEVFARYGQPVPPPTKLRNAYSKKRQVSHVGRLLRQPSAFH